MNKATLTEILYTLDYWCAEANNDHNDGWVQKDYKDKISVVRDRLKEVAPAIEFEKTKEEMCF